MVSATEGQPDRAKRGVLISTIGNLAVPISALVTAPILAQVLGVDGRGELAAATAPLILASAGLTLGLPESITHFVARGVTARKRLLLVGAIGAVLLGAVGSILIWLLSPLLAAGDPQLAELIALVGLALAPALVAAVLRGFIRGLKMWGLVALDQIVSSVFRVVLIVMLALASGLNPTTAAITAAAAAFVGAAVYLVAIPRLRRIGRSRPKTEGQAPVQWRPRTVAVFGLGVWAGSVAGVLLSRVDQVLVLPLAGAAALGIYAVAVSLSDVVRVFNSAVRDVIFTTQSSRTDDLKLGLASRVSTIITTIGAVCALIVAWVIVPPLFGEDFSAVVPTMALLLIGTILGNPGSVAAAGLSARGRPALRSLAIILGLVVNVALVFALVPPWGPYGAAVATSVANIITGALVVWFAHRYFGMSPRLFLALRTSDLRYVSNLALQFIRRPKGGTT